MTYDLRLAGDASLLEDTVKTSEHGVSEIPL